MHKRASLVARIERLNEGEPTHREGPSAAWTVDDNVKTGR
jgi:hypothetical protein